MTNETRTKYDRIENAIKNGVKTSMACATENVAPKNFYNWRTAARKQLGITTTVRRSQKPTVIALEEPTTPKTAPFVFAIPVDFVARFMETIR